MFNETHNLPACLPSTVDHSTRPVSSLPLSITPTSPSDQSRWSNVKALVRSRFRSMANLKSDPGNSLVRYRSKSMANLSFDRKVFSKVNSGLVSTISQDSLSSIQELLDNTALALLPPPEPRKPLPQKDSNLGPSGIDDPIVRRDSLHALVNELPDAHYATLRALVLHLARVQEHERQNRMSSSNLAICFAYVPSSNYPAARTVLTCEPQADSHGPSARRADRRFGPSKPCH